MIEQLSERVATRPFQLSVKREPFFKNLSKRGVLQKDVNSYAEPSSLKTENRQPITNIAELCTRFTPKQRHQI